MSERPAPAARRRHIRLSLWRASVAALLLAGLFALLFFVFLPGGGNAASAPPARLVDTPPGATDASVGVHPGRLARDFEASGTDVEAERFRLSALRGRPLIINFWATWCTSCSAEMPVLEEQRRAHEGDGLVIVAVNVGEGLNAARRFIEEFDLFEFAVAMDPSLAIADAYGIRGLPQSVFVDRNGVVQATYQGQLDNETMERYVRAAIDAVPGGEAPSRLRIVNTVPREHTLDVFPDEQDAGRVLFVSRRFRCDDSYCADAVASQLGAAVGVTGVHLQSGEEPPTLSLTFNPEALDLDELVNTMAEALRLFPDPLYKRELEVRYPGGDP
jgi:cytochrome c biogenesis protein CcmG/thiol:disulfide interchange protein DsbE